MNKNKTKTPIRIIVIVTFLIMITVNALANIIPINGQTTGQVSDAYPNLFAPAGFTFAIWGLIYLALAAYVLYQFGFFQGRQCRTNSALLDKIGLYFSISSIANAAWIFAWHYHKILLSMLLMIVILMCLIVINQIINKEQLSLREKIFIKIPFSIYFGWITVATIANATILLVRLGWDGFGISQVAWAVIVIILGAIIGTTTMLKNKDFFYGLVIIWAYIGILIKHISLSGFAGQYPVIINTVKISIAVLLVAEAYIVISKIKSN